MGSITNLTISGDNDDPIFPVKYYRHYMYCDVCGSFELKHWMYTYEDDQPQENDGLLKRVLDKAEAMMRSKHASKGVRCEQCHTTYAYGSPFFVDFKANPRGFTMDDVPLPLYKVYWIKGEELGPA
jgi:hypothetical protein